MAHDFTPDEIIELHTKFLNIDTDKNGLLSRKEWNDALSGIEHTAEDFDFADVNHDENLSFPEYVRLVSEIRKRRSEPGRVEGSGVTWQQVWDAYDTFSSADSEKRGHISAEELGAAMGQPADSAQVAKIMTSLEKANADKLSFKDYLNGVQSGVISTQRSSKLRSKARRVSLTPPPLPPRPIPEHVRRDAEQAFRRLEQGNSGGVGMAQFADILAAVNPHIHGPDINRLYAALDADRAGLITFDEFLEGCASGLIDLTQLPSAAPDYEWEIPFTELTFGPKLGEGTFGVVYKGMWRGTPVAIKMLKVEMANDVLQDFRDEIAILGKLRHPSVILFMGACTVAPNFCIVTEYMEGGSVYDAMHRRKVLLKKSRIIKMALQIAQGINYLHSSRPKIVHRDLKSLNCLVDDNWNVKIADFGLSCIKSSKQQLRDQVGTPSFMAPELLSNLPYNEKVDVYSFGMCLWELVTGEFPFEALSFERLQEVVPQGRRPAMPPTCGHALESLIQRCWDTDPKKRPSFDEIIAILLECLAAAEQPAGEKMLDKIRASLLKSKLQVSNAFDPILHKANPILHKAKKGLRIPSIMKKT